MSSDPPVALATGDAGTGYFRHPFLSMRRRFIEITRWTPMFEVCGVLQRPDGRKRTKSRQRSVELFHPDHVRFVN